MLGLLIVFTSSLACCLALTPVVRSLARRYGLVDHPDGRRKLQAAAIPLGGGVSILLAALAGVLAAVGTPLGEQLLAHASRVIGLGVAAVVIAGVGWIDDTRGLRGKHKLLGELVAVAIVVACGVVVRTACVFGLEFNLGRLAIPFTVFLLLGAINSLNLLDGADGLLSCIGVIICLALAAIAGQLAQWPAACIAAALAGALLGFLRYNFPPASIFMGDCGSMLVGLVIGVVAIEGSLKGPATVTLTAPLTLLTLPIFDTLAAIIRRKLAGRSIYTTDRGHLHHCLMRRGFSTPGMLRFVTALCLLTFFGALASVYWHAEWVAVVCAAAVVLILVATRLFGHVEVELLRKRLAAKLFANRADGEPKLMEVRMQGSADWPTLWRDLTAWAEQLDLDSLCLDINAPALHEAFLGHWERPSGNPEGHGTWRAEIPLAVGGHELGRLKIVGQRDKASASSKIAFLAGLVEDLEFALGVTAGVLPAIHAPLADATPSRLAAARKRRVAAAHGSRASALCTIDEDDRCFGEVLVEGIPPLPRKPR